MTEHYPQEIRYHTPSDLGCSGGSQRESYSRDRRHISGMYPTISFAPVVHALRCQNLIMKAPSANLPAMLVAQLLPFSKNLVARKFSDEDILEDVQFVRDELERNFESLT